tara:strand:+ start:15930 stop:16343 length:414 start_codon:yes stop_codon:yes gene_type:complete
MPNWCGNQLRVGGPEEDIARFVEVAVAEEEAEEVVFDEFTGSVRDAEDRRVHITLISRYNPPLRFLADLSRQFPMLTFYVEWEEGGLDFFGSAFIKAGEGLAIEQGYTHASWRIPEEFPDPDPERTVEDPNWIKKGF